MLLSLSSCFGGEHEHTPIKVAANAATCTEGGNTEYYRCGGCDKLFSDSLCENETTLEAQKTAPLNHEWSGDCDTDCNRDSCDATRTAESHLDADENDVCDNCGESVSSDIPVGDGDGEFLPPDEFDE